MADVPTSTTFIFVDRRRTGRGKSSNNRQKLLRRVKESIRNAKPEDIAAGGVGKTGGPQGAGSYTNQVKVTRHALAEPTFHYDSNTGEREVVLIGNDRYLKGDKFRIGKSGGGKGGPGGPGEDGEDDFIINVSRTEYFDVLFEDCVLPDLQETHEKDLPEFKNQRAGFQKVGNASQLAIVRSFKHSKGRRLALTRESRQELQDLEEELELLMAPYHEHAAGIKEWALRCQEITLRIQALKQKIAGYTVFEDVDLRFRKSEKIQVKSSDAVLFMLMDVSGSMDEDKKKMARKFFALQYAFIKRKFPQTDLVFIAHTTDAEEMEEEEFFTTQLSGGTVVSSAFLLARSIVKERYDAHQTNLYLSYASDGDNWDTDNPKVFEVFGDLLFKLRHAAYVQVGQSFSAGYGGSTLLSTMTSISEENRKLAIVKIGDETEVFDAFKKLYSAKQHNKVKK